MNISPFRFAIVSPRCIRSDQKVGLTIWFLPVDTDVITRLEHAEFNNKVASAAIVMIFFIYLGSLSSSMIQFE